MVTVAALTVTAVGDLPVPAYGFAQILVRAVPGVSKIATNGTYTYATFCSGECPPDYLPNGGISGRASAHAGHPSRISATPEPRVLIMTTWLRATYSPCHWLDDRTDDDTRSD